VRTFARLACLIAAAMMPSLGLAQDVTYYHHVYLDVDDKDDTGCTVAVHEAGWSGSITGIEQDLTILVEQSASPSVVSITRAVCSGGSFGVPVEVSQGDWLVGLGAGVADSDVVEGFVPRAALGGTPRVRLYFHSQLQGDNDVLLASGGRDGNPLVIAFQETAPIPLLGLPGFVLLALALATLAAVVLRRRLPAAAALLLAAALALGAAGLAWAAVWAMNGQVDDWDGIAALGNDGTGDSSIGDAAEDIVAGFAAYDATNLYVRVDVVESRLDSDLDGLVNVSDNCPGVANPGQEDTDGDGTGDACDTEECDGVDNDGDGTEDEGFTNTDGDGEADCVDADDDGDGTPDASDCAPLDPAVHPGATEVCDGVDNDCDSSIDEGLGQSTCGHGACEQTVDNCSGGVPQVCVPGQPVAELCNGIDDDCDGRPDEGFTDTDGDGEADCADADDDGDGTPDASDCAPLDPAVHPGATEVCDGADNDCDGETDEQDAIGCTTYYLDDDGDGYGAQGGGGAGSGGMVRAMSVVAESICVCSLTPPPGYAANATDCDDSNVAVHPGATETCNGIDDDCDGVTDEGVLCDDGNECTSDSCGGDSFCSNPPVLSGTLCTQNGGTVCDGSGSCVGCVTASDCPGSDTECQTRTCNNGECGMFFAPSGMPCGDGDACDGAGSCVPLPT
jgi:hypothetical protein